MAQQERYSQSRSSRRAKTTLLNLIAPQKLSTEINPWIIGSIAFALGVALAVGATAIVCIRKAARRENFEQL
jgi:hypothetical protein